MADIKDLMARVIDELYAGLTGGDAELPLPANMMVHFIQPGLPMHPSEFDFAVAGPYAGPSPLTMDFFRNVVETIQGDDTGMSREQVVAEAKSIYQAHLLGTWENWSRLVDFIPLVEPAGEQNGWQVRKGQGKHGHAQVVYGQAGRTLSQVYRDALNLCEVANEELGEEKQQLVLKMRALLQEEHEVVDFITGEKRKEIRDSRVLQAYDEYRNRYENAVIDYASRLARSQSGSAADLVEWSRSGGIYRSRAQKARRDWEGQGYKNDVERAQAILDQVLGTSAVQWIAELRGDVDDVHDNMQGAYGYPFYPATVIPGSFARNEGWTTYENRELHRTVNSSSSSRRGSASLGFSLGLFNATGGGGGGRHQSEFQIKDSVFGMKFQYTQVEIARPWFNPGFAASRSWRLKTEFTDAYQTDVLSDGKSAPKGALVGYPTKALFVRDLTFYSRDLADYMKTQHDDISAGGVVGVGPFLIGGTYQQSTNKSESNFEFTDAGIRIPGLQLVAFLSTLMPMAPTPSPKITKWL
ncbi:hypothetical protein [Streptomyces sp. NPDC002187]|uniref:hypothetical protein n=1 Tax=Streptomyces sp. NPDC002187 TaxID=3364637 RepID=UPI0036C179F4